MERKTAPLLKNTVISCQCYTNTCEELEKDGSLGFRKYGRKFILWYTVIVKYFTSI